jgi:hypothetical protein
VRSIEQAGWLWLELGRMRLCQHSSSEICVKLRLRILTVIHEAFIVVEI